MLFRQDNLTEEAYEAVSERFGGDPYSIFRELALPIVQRFYRQNDLPAPDITKQEALCDAVWRVAKRKGFPGALPEGEAGEAYEMPVDERAEFAGQVLDMSGITDDVMSLAMLATQFILTLTNPEFTQCRETYHQADEDGILDRQDLDECLTRIAGSFCEDCPYFTTKGPEDHLAALREHWAGEADLGKHEGAFLPGDFRELRLFLHLFRRYGTKRRRSGPPKPSVSPEIATALASIEGAKPAEPPNFDEFDDLGEELAALDEPASHDDADGSGDTAVPIIDDPYAPPPTESEEITFEYDFGDIGTSEDGGDDSTDDFGDFGDFDDFNEDEDEADKS